MKARVLHGNCLDHMKALADAGEMFDGCLCDPPYHLTSIVKRFGKTGSAPAQHGTDGAFARASKGFMGKIWDGGDIAFRPETWRLLFNILKPGAHLLAFSGTRTYHRMACAIEDAGFEIRDQIEFLHDSAEDAWRFLDTLNDGQRGAFVKLIERSPGQLAWLYGTGMNKRGYLSYLLEGSLCEKKVDRNVYRDTGKPMRTEPPFRHPQADELWGWAGGIKPAFEPIVVARKPLAGTEVANMLAHGVGVFNVDACRIGIDPTDPNIARGSWSHDSGADHARPGYEGGFTQGGRRSSEGRYPANIIHDGSEEVLESFAQFGDRIVNKPSSRGAGGQNGRYGPIGAMDEIQSYADAGSAARFYFSAKAGPDDHFGSSHPTIKPVSLIKWLADLILPQGARLIDPFSGTGPIVFARPDLDMTLIEQDEAYCQDIKRRIAHVEGGGLLRSQEIARRKGGQTEPPPADGLFGWIGAGDAA